MRRKRARILRNRWTVHDAAMATSAPVRRVAVPVRRSPRLRLSGPSCLIELLGVDQANAPIAGGFGSKRSYYQHEFGDSAPSKHLRTQPSDCRFIHSLMLSLTGKDTFPTLNFSRCSSDKHDILVVTTRKLEYHEPAGYLSRLRLMVDNNQTYKIQVTIVTTLQRL